MVFDFVVVVRLVREIFGQGAVGIHAFGWILAGGIDLDGRLRGLNGLGRCSPFGFPLTTHATEVAAQGVPQVAELRNSAGEAFLTQDVVETALMAHVERHPTQLAHPLAQRIEHPRQALRAHGNESHGRDDQHLRKTHSKHKPKLARAAGCRNRSCALKAWLHRPAVTPQRIS